MSNKFTRLSELAKIHPIAATDHRRLKDENGKIPLFENMSRERRRKLAAEGRRLANDYRKIMKELSLSGAKFPADKILREMALEYTNRYAASGIYTQPISFNYFEPFLHIKLIRQAAPYADIEQECNHLFYAEDYFEYVTSADSDGFSVSSLLDLPQDQIFHFSTSGLVTDISFLNGEGREFVVAGFSMIRRGGSLHWYLIGGEALTDDEWKIRCSDQPESALDNVAPTKRAFLAECHARNGAYRGKPIPLEGTSSHIRTIIAGEFDIGERRHLSRCYLAEYEHSFDVICDDPEIFSDISSADTRAKIMTTMTERFGRSAVLWSLAEGLFQLPRYFNVRLAMTIETSRQSRQRIAKKKGGKGLGRGYVVIPAIAPKSQAPTLAITMVKLPQYEIETEGHWRRLPDGQSGLDRHGNSVPGRTWVASSSKWKPMASTSPTIFVKDTLSSAKLKIAQYIEASARVAEEAALRQAEPGPVDGELYVMRCSAMKEQIFKVGYTNGDSAERAQQLSSATGVALAFAVVKKWRHADVKRLETEVHMLLAPYRINDNREFFMASYEAIEKVVESAIARADGLAT